MSEPSFLARKTFGLPNYFLIALGFAVFVALLPRAARLALQSNTNRAEDWLPQTYTESSDLKWFRRHFISEGFVLVTWEGCTLGNTEKLDLLQKKLSEKLQSVEPETVEALKAKKLHTGRWFRKIISGPSMLRELTEPPLSLSYEEAVKRLEGAIIGPPAQDKEGNSLGDQTRVTALVAYLAPEGYDTNLAMRNVVDYIEQVTTKECGVPLPKLHMGGPTVDNVTIDKAGKGNFAQLAAMSGLVGLTIAYWCFRDLALTAMVVAVGVVSAMTSMALVFYYGVIEVVFLGLATPKYGRMDAVLMSMPPLVYVLGLSGAIHLVNYYRDARVEGGLDGAVERACRMGFKPCLLVALTTSLGFGCLVVSDIIPIKKFGGFTGISVLATVAIMFTMLPVYLHRFPPKRIGKREWKDIPKHDPGLPPWGTALAQWLVNHGVGVSVACTVLMLVVGAGVFKLESRIQLLKLLDPQSDLIQDYAWAEDHLGNLVPMEVVISVPPSHLRTAEEHAEADGKQYKMTMLERLAMMRRLEARVEALPEVSRTLSVSTYAPEESHNATAAVRRGNDYTVNKNLQDNRESFRDYLQNERTAEGQVIPGSRELWRLSARVTALKDIDYGQFDHELRKQVEPVLMAYRQRDELIRALHAKDKQLEGSQLCVLFYDKPDVKEPNPNSPEGILADVLRESGVANKVEEKQGSLAFYNLAQLEDPKLPAEQRTAVTTALQAQDVVVLASEDAEAAATLLGIAPTDDVAIAAAEGNQAAEKVIAKIDMPLVDVVELPVPAESVAVATDSATGPNSIRALYTGVIPLVFKTQRQLMVGLQQSAQLATFLIVVAMSISLRSVIAGCIAMLPNLFPNLLVFGALGWLGFKIDIGIMMSASIGLGVSVDSTLHQLTWVGDGLKQGLNRRGAVLLAYDRCAASMLQAALVSGLGLLVFALSTFTPTRQFGYLMLTILAAALIGDTIMLPALIASPLGWFFELRRNKNKPPGDSGGPPGGSGGEDLSKHRPEPTNGEPVRRTAEEATPAIQAGLKGKPQDRAAGESAHAQPPKPLGQAGGEPMSPANAELLKKLRSFRRPAS